MSTNKRGQSERVAFFVCRQNRIRRIGKLNKKLESLTETNYIKINEKDFVERNIMLIFALRKTINVMERVIEDWVFKNGFNKYDEDNWGMDLYVSGELTMSFLHKRVEDFENYSDEELIEYVQTIKDNIQ